MRLKYIDSLRGLAMLMVVYSHIMSFGMPGYTPSPVGRWIVAVMLPLFFFISGFCAYKSNPVCGIRTYGILLYKKAIKILIPTFIMMGLMMSYTDKNMLEYLFRYDKCGYWFTWVLFQIFVIYLPVLMLSSKVKQPVLSVAILLSPIFLMYFIFKYIGFNYPAAVLFEWVKVKQFYLFFILGVLFRKVESESFNLKCFPRFGKVSLHKPFITLTLAMLMICNILPPPPHADQHDIVVLLSVMFIYFSFRVFESWFNESENKLSKILTDIGGYTLPIYLIHFFLLFQLPKPVVTYLSSLQTDTCFGTNSCCSLVEWSLVGGISVLLCYVCIYITRFIKTASPFLARWMLGE